MRSMQFISVVALLALGTACRQDATDANAANNEGDAATPAVEQARPAEQAGGPQQATTRAGWLGTWMVGGWRSKTWPAVSLFNV